MRNPASAGARDEPAAIRPTFAGRGLDAEAARALAELLEPTSAYDRGVVLPTAPAFGFLLEEGWACLERTGKSRTQILVFFLPGDFVGLDLSTTPLAGGSVRSITPVRLRALPSARRAAMVQNAMLKATIAAQNIDHQRRLQSQAYRLGALAACERTAHLLAELYRRLGTSNQPVEFPIKQETLAEVLGLSLIHVNRVLLRLKAAQLAWTDRGRLIVPNLDALEAFAEGKPTIS